MTEFKRAQQALKKMAREVGMDNMPIHNEALRPLLLIMQSIAERHDSGVVVFDHVGTRPPASASVDELKFGLFVPISEFMVCQRELRAEIEKHPTLAHDITKNARKLICHPAGNSMVMIYHEDLWIPSGALLPEKRH